jgi:hypothetical protein
MQLSRQAQFSARTGDPSLQLLLKIRCTPSGDVQLSVTTQPEEARLSGSSAAFGADPSKDKLLPGQMERLITARDIPEQAFPATLAIALSELARSALMAHQENVLQRRAEALDRQRQDLELRKAKLDAARSTPGRDETVETGLIPPVGTRGDIQAALGIIAAESIPYQPMFGFELGLSYQQFAVFRWSAEGSFVLGGVETPLGTLDLLRSGISLGGDFHLQGLPALEVGPRVQVHLLSGQGHSRRGFDEVRQWGYALSGSLRASLEIAASRSVVLRSSFEVGPVLRSMTFTAAGQTAYAFEGAWFAWGLAGAWRPAHDAPRR